MEDTEKLVLIDGEFSPADAKEILQSIFLSKINFHQMKNFSSQERLGKDDEVAMKRIPKLQKTMKKISKIILEAYENGETLVIKSNVKISFASKKNK